MDPQNADAFEKDGAITTKFDHSSANMSNKRFGEITMKPISTYVYENEAVADYQYDCLARLKHKNVAKIACQGFKENGNTIVFDFYGKLLKYAVHDHSDFWHYNEDRSVVAPTQNFVEVIKDLMNVLAFLRREAASIDEEDILENIAVLPKLDNMVVIKCKKGVSAKSDDDILASLLELILRLQNVQAPSEFQHFINEMKSHYLPTTVKSVFLVEHHPLFKTSAQKESSIRSLIGENHLERVNINFFSRNNRTPFYENWYNRALMEKSDFSDRLKFTQSSDHSSLNGFIEFARQTFGHINQTDKVDVRRIKPYNTDDVTHMLERVGNGLFNELFEYYHQNRRVT